MHRKRSFILSLALLLVLARVVGAQEPARHTSVGVLVISVLSDSSMDVRGNKIAEQVSRMAQQEHVADGLPVMAYHFDAAAERFVCESKLHVHSEDLLFVGVVEVDARQVPSRVLFRISKAQDVDHDAQLVFQKAHDYMMKTGQVPEPRPTTIVTEPTPGVKATPWEQGSAPPSRQASPTVALRTFEIINQEGQVATDFVPSTDGALFIRLQVKNMAPEVEHVHHVRVVLTDATGLPYPATLGGDLDMKPGDSWDSRTDVLSAISKGNNGFKLAHTPLGARAGQWTASLEIDGKVVADRKFRISTISLGGTDKVSVEQFVVGNERGQVKTRLSPSTDAGAFAFIKLRNDYPQGLHQHVLYVWVVDAAGVQRGRRLGGAFTVQPGEDLSRKEYPAEVDREGNGLLFKGSNVIRPPGDYKFIVELDGKQILEKPFTILP